MGFLRKERGDQCQNTGENKIESRDIEEVASGLTEDDQSKNDFQIKQCKKEKSGICQQGNSGAVINRLPSGEDHNRPTTGGRF